MNHPINEAQWGRTKRPARLGWLLTPVAFWACGGAPAGSGAPGSTVEVGSVASSTTRVALRPEGRPWRVLDGTTATPLEADTELGLSVFLRLRDKGAALAELASVNDPTSPNYGRYLSPEAFHDKYAPAPDDVAAVRGWAESHGLTVDHVPGNRLFVALRGRAADVEAMFGTRLARDLASPMAAHGLLAAPTIPAALAGKVDTVLGLEPSRLVAHHVRIGGVRSLAQGQHRPSRPALPRGVTPPPPEGYRNAEPCSPWYGQRTDNAAPPLTGFPAQLPWVPCGYKPPALRAGYGLADAVEAGNDGTGVTVAIVDAFPASPTLFRDSATYAAQNDPAHPLTAALFTAVVAPAPRSNYEPDPRNIQGWWGEQTLDVQAVHAIAPGAHILFVGAQTDEDTSLTSALTYVIENNRASIISNSYGGAENGSPGFVAWESIAIQAGLQGIGLYFASGDSGDDSIDPFGFVGQPSATFPASLPEVTAVGGTSLALDGLNRRSFELGWETGASFLVPTASTTPAHWSPEVPQFGYGAGGGTSQVYLQPTYQSGRVPPRIANVHGPSSRVVPDLAMLADPTTGMIIGQTQTFPDGVYYDQFRIGGTSLATPLLAAVVALAEQRNGHRAGFANPKLYHAASTPAFVDILPGAARGVVQADYTNYVDASDGFVYTFLSLGYRGQSIGTATGYDNVTGLGVPNGTAFFDALK